jgi:AraC-like DNA-binding protein
MVCYFPLHLLSVMPVVPALYCYLIAFCGHAGRCRYHITYNLAAMLPVSGYLIWFLLLSQAEKAGLFFVDSSLVTMLIMGFHVQFYIQSGAYYFLCFLLVYRQRRFGYLWEIDRSYYNIRWVQGFLLLFIAGFIAYIVYCVVCHFNRSCREFGYECGFGSRASFYRAFKKYTDTTPCKYRKKEDSLPLTINGRR